MGKFLDYVLGGASTPMAGDGYGGVPRTRSPKSPKSPALGSSEYSASDVSNGSLLPTSRKSSVNPTDHGNDASGQESPQQLDPKRIWRRPNRSPNGIHAPRSSVAIMPALIAPSSSPRPSMESFRTASEEASIIAGQDMPEPPKDVPWEDYEIPQELEILRDDIPKEIQNIIQESIDEHRAMRASRIQSQADNVQGNIDFSRIPSENDRPIVAESSAMASARSTSASDYSRSSLDISAASDTSVESGLGDNAQLKPPTNVIGQLIVNTSQDILVTKGKPSRLMTEMERRFQESKFRTHKSHGLFKLLQPRKSKDYPSADSPVAEPTMSECTGCLDDFPDKEAVGLPCRHKYCSPCFSQLVSTSIQHESSYPPKCCLTDIPKKTIRDNLPPLICAQFEEKALEYAVPIGNRYYCVSANCGKWIDTRHARRTNGAIECPHCATKLCTLCRGPQHPSNQDCPQDFGLDRTLEQAERAGWRRCYNCRTMVELNTGCRHITCKCRAEFCYTCGAVWRTCHCTEADQARREEEIRTRLARFEADQRAEEEEMRAAMEAVEAAERQLREEREAEERRMEEEARELQRLEAERLQKIADWFEYLRGVIERVRIQQTSAIEKRHDREWDAIDKMRDDLDSVTKAAERELFVKCERDKIVASTEITIKALQRQHAATMMETITRHRKDQDDLFERSIESEDQDNEIHQAETLQELMLAQETERTTLKSQQAREVQKWKQRGESSLQAFDSRMLALKMRLEEAENINKRESEVRSTIFADGKWSEVLFEARLAMLAEDERKLGANGGEAPSAPKRETVVMPGKEVPIIQQPTPSQKVTPAASLPQSTKETVCFRTREAPHSRHRSPSMVAAPVSPLETLMKEAAERPLRVKEGARKPLSVEQKRELDAMMRGRVDVSAKWDMIVHG